MKPLINMDIHVAELIICNNLWDPLRNSLRANAAAAVYMAGTHLQGDRYSTQGKYEDLTLDLVQTAADDLGDHAGRLGTDSEKEASAHLQALPGKEAGPMKTPSVELGEMFVVPVAAVYCCRQANIQTASSRLSAAEGTCERDMVVVVGHLSG